MTEDELSIEKDLQGAPLHLDGQGRPLPHRHLTGRLLDGLPVLAMPSQKQALFGGVEGDFIPVKTIRSRSCIGHAGHQTHIGPVLRCHENLHACFTVSKWLQITHQLVALCAAKMKLVALHPPLASVSLETFGWKRHRRFLEAFAKDHLAVYAAIDLMVYILNAGAGEMP